MNFDCEASGVWIIDPADLAERLDLSIERLQEEQALGLIRTQIEKGRGRDRDYFRVTVQSRATSWQGVFDREGNLVGEGKQQTSI